MRIREDLKRKLAERKVHITNVNDSPPCDAIPGDKRPRVLSFDAGFNPHHPVPDDEDNSHNFHDTADDEDSHNFHNTADDDNSTDSSYVEEGSFLTMRKSKRKIRGCC